MWQRFWTVSILSLLTAAVDETHDAVPVSAYAPLADIENQVDFFTNRIGKKLESPDDYDSDGKEGVVRDASTLAVLSLLLAHHDESGKLNRNATALLRASQELIESADDYQDALSAWEAVLAAPRVAGEVSTMGWQPVADLSVLMKQVPIVNNSLRRGVHGRRFQRSKEKTAGLAATVAALAQASACDTAYCSDAEEEQLWAEMCEEMRDSAAQVNIAVRQLDQAAAKKAMDQVIQSCDRCHHRFRD